MVCQSLLFSKKNQTKTISALLNSIQSVFYKPMNSDIWKYINIVIHENIPILSSVGRIKWGDYHCKLLIPKLVNHHAGLHLYASVLVSSTAFSFLVMILQVFPLLLVHFNALKQLFISCSGWLMRCIPLLYPKTSPITVHHACPSQIPGFYNASQHPCSLQASSVAFQLSSTPYGLQQPLWPDKPTAL